MGNWWLASSQRRGETLRLNTVTSYQLIDFVFWITFDVNILVIDGI